MPSKGVRRRLGRKDPTTGLPIVVIALSVLAILAGSVVVVADTNPYPPLTQGLHDLVAGVQKTGLASTLTVTDPSGKQLFTGTTLTRFASLELPNNSLLYNSTSGASGQVSDELTANIVIQQGTPTNFTISGSHQIIVDGKQVATVPIGVKGNGAPAGTVQLDKAARSGAQLWGDFGGNTPTSATPHTVTFATSGSATVCFAGASCVTKTWSNGDIASLDLNALPNAGTFSLSIGTTTGTNTTSICTPVGSCAQPTQPTCPYGYSLNGNGACQKNGNGIVLLSAFTFCAGRAYCEA